MNSNPIAAWLFVCVGMLCYLLPTLVAILRQHHNRGAIGALNLLLGWTFLGYVIALVWSLSYVIPKRERYQR